MFAWGAGNSFGGIGRIGTVFSKHAWRLGRT